MDPNERKGWTEIVTAEDLDSHMASIGQAETNAYLVFEMLKSFPLNKGDSLLVPGCGTGQMFDYIKPAQIGDYDFTFTDINSKYLERLKKRLSKTQDAKYVAIIDDIESTKLSGHYSGILTVLLLQHIEWKKGIDSMLKLTPSRMYFIIQQQASDKHPITKERKLCPSIAKFAQIANPCLVPRNDLMAYLEKRGYKLLKVYEKQVPDEKTMVGLVFEKR